MPLTGKHVVILGTGRSGRAAAALALRHGARVTACDAAAPDKAFAGMPELVDCHGNITAADAPKFACDLLVVSPGIDTYGPLVTAFGAHAGEVIGEVELAARFYQGKIIGITGTNGKTTTTELIGRLLERAGLGGTPCGNYGTPFAEVVMMAEPPAAVALELSSFQLETITTLHPVVAVWLNFAPDHMDRYPTVESYRAAKERIFINQSAADTAVIRCGDLPDGVKSKAVWFSTEDETAEWYSDGHLIHHRGEVVFDLEHGSGLRGLHNAENAMASLAAVEAIGVGREVWQQALAGFAPPPHRCELVRTLDGVEYLNDSKATNLHALESALRSQTRPVVLIAGGKEKGLDYAPVIPLLKKKGVAAVTFGQIAGKLAEVLGQAVAVESCSTLDEAVQLARKHAPRGSTVLLSPGTSSFDQFNGYEQRGDRFREIVHQLR